MAQRVYPEEPSGPFPVPPATFEDRAGRTIEVEATNGFTNAQLEDVVDMYVDFDPADRAQGIPPSGEERIRRWLDAIIEYGLNVLTRHHGDVVGHATLVPDTDTPAALETRDAVEWELAIFVLQGYQQAGIGTALIKHLLGYGAHCGIDRVWLTVERWNKPAITLYKRVGFEPSGSVNFEQEMSILLA